MSQIDRRAALGVIAGMAASAWTVNQSPAIAADQVNFDNDPYLAKSNGKTLVFAGYKESPCMTPSSCALAFDTLVSIIKDRKLYPDIVQIPALRMIELKVLDQLAVAALINDPVLAGTADVAFWSLDLNSFAARTFTRSDQVKPYLLSTSVSPFFDGENTDKLVTFANASYPTRHFDNDTWAFDLIRFDHNLTAGQTIGIPIPIKGLPQINRIMTGFLAGDNSPRVLATGRETPSGSKTPAPEKQYIINPTTQEALQVDSHQLIFPKIS